MSQDRQQIQQLNHSLSRLALAKAIKTPDDAESEPWQKSVIFNQPFIKELHKQRQQLHTNNKSNRREQSTENKKPQIQVNRIRKNSTNSSPTAKRLSEPSIKKPIAIEAPKNLRSCLPSDSEEEEEAEDSDDDDDDDDKDSVGSEVFEVKRQQKPASIPQRPRPASTNSSRDDISTPSRGSTSSNTLPITDDDEEDSTPNAPLHHVRSNSWALPHTDDNNNSQYYRSQLPQLKNQYNHVNKNRHPSMDNTMMMMDPLHYQRYHQYQQQLQFQQQLQYQQALALQHHQQQQQQLYLLSQSPSAFFPPNARVSNSNEEPYINNKRHSGGYQHQHSGRGNQQSKLSSTDLRRRAEMLRSSNESASRLPPPPPLQQMYYQQPITPPVMKSNNRRPSYNL